MKAALYHGREDVRVESVDPDELGPRDVRVDVAACGICGSDLHEYDAGPLFVPEDPHPMTGASTPLRMGHEFAGAVSEVGSEVTDLAVGDAVTVNPIRACGDCRYCAAGKRHLCSTVALAGVSADGGGFAERSVVPARSAVPLPESVSPRHGALVEPFAVALHAVRRAGVAAGDSAAVYGCGPIGLAIVQVLGAAGATDVFVSEPRDARRELAGEFGAATIDPTEDDAVRRVKAATDGGVDAAFEVAGIERTYNAAVSSAKRDGTVLVVSVFEDTVETHPNGIVLAERTVRGTMSYLAGDRADGEFQAVAKLFADERLDPEPLVTDTLPLDDVVAGFESLRDPESDDVKILVEP